MSLPIPGTASTQGDTGTNTPTTKAHTTGAGEFYMVVTVAMSGVSLGNVASVTFGAQNLTKLISADGSSVRNELWAGSVLESTADTVTVTYGGGSNCNAAVAIQSFADVVRVGTPKSNVETSGATSTLTFDSGDVSADELGIDAISTHPGDSTPSIGGGGQTARFTRFHDGASQTYQDGSSKSNSSTMQWTGLSHANRDSCHVGVPLIGPSSASGDPFTASIGGASENDATVTASNVTSSTLAFPRAVRKGSLLLVVGHNWRATDPTGIAVTDTLSNTYTVLETGSLSWASGVSRGVIAYAVSGAAGSCTVTFDPPSTGNFISWAIAEFYGNDDNPLEASSSEATGTGTAPSHTIGTLTYGALAIGVMVNTSPASPTAITPTAPSIQIAEDESNANAPYSFVFQNPDAPASLTFAWTLGASQTWRVRLFSFKPLSRDAVDGGDPPSGGLLRPVPQSGGLV